MKVRELMRLLEDQDPDADVLLATQRESAVEHRLLGVVFREEMYQLEAGPSPEGDPSDVLLVEGEQLRYGSKAAWQAVRR